MLTADLAISFRRGNKIEPRLVRTNDADIVRDAENLILIFNDSIGKTRHELDAELEEYVGTGTDYKVLRGLIKLLQDRSEFAVKSVAEPATVRRALFFAAKHFHPVTAENRRVVIEEIAAEFNCEPAEILQSVYADLTNEQKLLEFETLAPLELLERYNVAQAQALFYRCGEMTIRVAPQKPAGYRQIFGAIKYFKLIHTVLGNPRDGYEIRLDGAASVFHRSQKYGVQMAVFLPVLLLCSDWEMTAEIDLKGGERAFFELDSKTHNLKSHYADEPAYNNPVHEKLVRDWAKRESDWTLAENREIVNLKRTAFVSDFVLIHADGAKVYLEILGFWTPESLQKRIAELKTVNFENFIIAAWEELRGSRDEPVTVPDNVILFKSKLEPQILEATAEKLAF